MKIDRSPFIGCEITLPGEWPKPACEEGGETYHLSRFELFQWSKMWVKEPSTPEQVERDFRLMAQKYPAYSELEFGRFSLLGHDQIWVRHKMWEQMWAKTYCLAFGREKHYVWGYCPDAAAFARNEPAWDAVIASFRPIPAYPQPYDTECQRAPGEPSSLRLVASEVIDSPHLATLALRYEWDASLPNEAATHLAARAIAYLSCAIYDAASEARLGCQLSPIPHGRRPAWLIEGASAPISVTQTQVEVERQTCEIVVGPSIWRVRGPMPASPELLQRLEQAFQDRFKEIRV